MEGYLWLEIFEYKKVVEIVVVGLLVYLYLYISI